MGNNVVQLGQRRHKAVPAAPQSDRHLRALQEVQRLCEVALAAGGLGEDKVIESALIVCLHEAFKGTEWKVRFERIREPNA